MDTSRSSSPLLNSPLSSRDLKCKYTNIDLDALPPAEEFFNVFSLSDEEAFEHFQRVDRSYGFGPACCPFCRCELGTSVIVDHVERCLELRQHLYSTLLFRNKRIKTGIIFLHFPFIFHGLAVFYLVLTNCRACDRS